MSAESKAKHSV